MVLITYIGYGCRGSVAPSIARGEEPTARFFCDPRWLHWAHPEVREFLGSVGGAALPGVLATAQENFVRSRALPAVVVSWNEAHSASEVPLYNATAEIEGAVSRGEGAVTNFWA